MAAEITYFFNRAQTRLAATQADVAVEKLKLDLFEKRYALYTAAKQLIMFLAELHLTSKAFLKVLADRSNLSTDDDEAWRETADAAAKLRDLYAKLPSVSRKRWRLSRSSATDEINLALRCNTIRP